MNDSKTSITLNTRLDDESNKDESFKLKHKLKNLLELVPKGSRVQLSVTQNQDIFCGLIKINGEGLSFITDETESSTIFNLYHELEEIIKNKIIIWKSNRVFALNN